MVNRVTVSPSEVRAYGDIVSPAKELEDFTNFMCSLELSDGVYTLGYDDTASYLNLSASPTTVEYGSSVVLTATLTIGGERASGEVVYFYDGETVIGSEETDSNGVATLTKSDFDVGIYSIKAVYDELESHTVTVTVSKISVQLSLSTDKSTVVSGDSFTLSGVLSLGSGKTVKLYDNGTFVKNITTGTDGAFSEVVSGASVGSYSYYVAYLGDETTTSVTSAPVSVTVSTLPTECMELGVTGSSFSTGSNTPFTYTGNVFVDWGDNTGFVGYTGGTLSHTYASSGNYAVKVYGEITGIGAGCFSGCTGLTIITIPDSITSLGVYCFDGCTSLTEIVLNWESASEILTYNIVWTRGCTSFDHFLIPQGTKSLYTAKIYPSALLKEPVSYDDISDPTLVDGKSILSYADVSGGDEYATLQVQLLDGQASASVSDIPIAFYKYVDGTNDVLLDTVDTDSNGQAEYTYQSAGVGDVSIYASADNGSLVSEIYEVQDTWKYDSTTYSSDHIYDLQLPSSQYTLEFDILKKTNATYSQATGGVQIGEAPSTSYFMIGSGSETNYYISRWGTNVSFTNLTLLTQNTWKSVKCEINGTSASIIIDGVTYSVTGISADTSKLCRVNCNSDNLNVRNIKIKPL